MVPSRYSGSLVGDRRKAVEVGIAGNLTQHKVGDVAPRYSCPLWRHVIEVDPIVSGPRTIDHRQRTHCDPLEVALTHRGDRPPMIGEGVTEHTPSQGQQQPLAKASCSLAEDAEVRQEHQSPDVMRLHLRHDVLHASRTKGRRAAMG